MPIFTSSIENDGF